MEKKTTKERLHELSKEYNVSQAEMCRLTGIPKSTMSLYWSGKRVPKQNVLTLFATVFGIQEAWLMGFDVPMKSNEDSSVPEEIVDEDIMFLEMFKLLDENDRKVIIRMMENMMK